MDCQAEIEAVARILCGCRSALFVTGAGISADSGVPTYRGIGGLYEVDTTDEGLPIEEILSGQMLTEDPGLTWKYLAQIAAAAQGATFNRAHAVIAAIEQRFHRVWTLTQNVDGFHLAAGARNVIEIHGAMRSLSCLGCRRQTEAEPHVLRKLPPRCTACQAILRPDVVLFGEMLPPEAVASLRREIESGFDIVFSIGTSSMFPYIQQPIWEARQRGIPTVEINPSETELSGMVDYRVSLGAAEALDAIWARMPADG